VSTRHERCRKGRWTRRLTERRRTVWWHRGWVEPGQRPVERCPLCREWAVHRSACMSGVGGALWPGYPVAVSPAAARFLCCNEACPFPHVTALVDPTLRHKNHAEVLVEGSEIVVRPVAARQS
jgi:hypothetical protein